MDECKAAPRRLQEVRGERAKGDVDAGGGAATVGTEVVRRGRSALTRKPPLFCVSAPPRYEPYFRLRFLEETLGCLSESLDRFNRYPPSLGQSAHIGVPDPLPGGQVTTPGGVGRRN